MNVNKDIGRKKPEGIKSPLPDLDLSFPKSKEQVWAELSHALDTGMASEGKSPVTRMLWAMAASIALLLGMATFARFYSKELSAGYGQHISAILPDGSEITLNAGTEVKYHPLWWRFDRKVNLVGEAFFDVAKGKRFDVVSPNGTTTVLGTRFNVYARGDQYEVTCYSGEVRVVSRLSGHVLDITPGEQASLNNDGSLRLSKMKDPKVPVSWMNNMFMFTATPLSVVFEEIERQYAVEIVFKGENQYLYTGNFSRNQPVEQVLKMVCRPYGLDFVTTEKGFLIEIK